MSIKGQGHSLTLIKGHSDFKVKCLTFGLYTQVSESGPLVDISCNFAKIVLSVLLASSAFYYPYYYHNYFLVAKIPNGVERAITSVVTIP